MPELKSCLASSFNLAVDTCGCYGPIPLSNCYRNALVGAYETVKDETVDPDLGY